MSHLDVLRLPARSRGWLAVNEAARYVDRSAATIQQWLNRGVLPKTDRTSRGVYLYAKSDLDRIMNGPHRGPRGIFVDFEKLHQQIMESAAEN